MTENSIIVTYLMAYIIATIYLVVLGCYMLTHRGNPLSTHGEQVAKLRLTRTMGVSMLIIAFETLLYLPPMLLGYTSEHNIYKLLFLVVLMLSIPMAYNMMHAVVQQKGNTTNVSCALGLPFLALAAWQMISSPNPSDNTLVVIGAALGAAGLLFLLIRFTGEYRIYLHRIQSEYSETTSREIFWSWICFSGFAVQGILFVSYQLAWTPLLEVLYLAVSFLNSAFLCYCTCRQRTLDLDVVPETEPEVTAEDNAVENTFYADIEQKLETLCEGKHLFLEPGLTRETLCLRLGINHTYLSMFFHSRGITFYHYINSLRIEYAVRLMKENPDLPINEVARQSGFRSQPTFRKVFQEMIGCLPSEVKKPTRIQ